MNAFTQIEAYLHVTTAPHLTLIRDMTDGTVHRVERRADDLPALYGTLLPALMAGRTVRIGHTKHVNVSALAERSMG